MSSGLEVGLSENIDVWGGLDEVPMVFFLKGSNRASQYLDIYLGGKWKSKTLDSSIFSLVGQFRHDVL